MEPSRQTILIVGFAREGESLARYFASRRYRVIVTDISSLSEAKMRARRIEGNVEWVLGRHAPELVADADRVFVSPGVPEDNPVVMAARQAGKALESMTTLFFQLCPASIIGVTGSSGKTTTSGLIGHILGVAGRDVVVGGNIGTPMLDLLPSIRPETDVVLELSSFQLALMERSPHIAVVTNISPNHLDRHGTMAEYVQAKKSIVRYQASSDYVVLNRSDPESSSFAREAGARQCWFGIGPAIDRGAGMRGRDIGLWRDGDFTPVMQTGEVPLLGEHNRENLMAALAVAALLDVPARAMRSAVMSFRAPAHRLETVTVRDGIRYVDDSIATSPARASVALRAMDAPVILIAGGRDKNLPWEDFAGMAVRTVRVLLLIGEAAPKIENAMREVLSIASGLLKPQAIKRCASLETAVHEARSLAHPGDIVLLAPGCTSYDMFANFAERGNAFVRAVERLDAA
ncbi:MAG: UDP-N-acetylmuramoyl-L-alanine--D-glutamate ligase [Chloroflexota bacterium]